jgi:hypothetical protein
MTMLLGRLRFQVTPGEGASSSVGGTGGDKETLTLGMTADLSSGWTRPTSPDTRVGPAAYCWNVCRQGELR